jgi:S1-C subfamily serine protease
LPAAPLLAAPWLAAPWFAAPLLGALWIVSAGLAWGQSDPSLETLRQSIVSLSIDTAPNARSAATLGTKRRASGVVIDGDGLIVTVGYAILEAATVEITLPGGAKVPGTAAGYDAETGFGLVRALKPIKARPLTLGQSSAVKVRDPVMILGWEDGQDVNSGMVVSRRTFTGYWEYLLEAPLYTIPAVSNFAGAALVDQNFTLIGIGSLFIEEAVDRAINIPGNLFIPIDALKPILPELARKGRATAPSRPWLGLNVTEQFGRVVVTRVTRDSPAHAGGLNAGDMIFEVAGKPVTSLEEFYRALWGQGGAGVKVPMTVLQARSIHNLSVTSGDRYQFYRAQPLY